VDQEGRWEREQREIEDQLKKDFTNKCRIHFFSQTIEEVF
jgi:hypothetical protein